MYIAIFVSVLWNIAEYCEYGVVLKDMLRDQVVCGISGKDVQCYLV